MLSWTNGCFWVILKTWWLVLKATSRYALWCWGLVTKPQYVHLLSQRHSLKILHSFQRHIRTNFPRWFAVVWVTKVFEAACVSHPAVVVVVVVVDSPPTRPRRRKSPLLILAVLFAEFQAVKSGWRRRHRIVSDKLDKGVHSYMYRKFVGLFVGCLRPPDMFTSLGLHRKETCSLFTRWVAPNAAFILSLIFITFAFASTCVMNLLLLVLGMRKHFSFTFSLDLCCCLPNNFPSPASLQWSVLTLWSIVWQTTSKEKEDNKN